MTYSEQLQDPRWQKKRLEILSAAKFTCQQCKADDKTLHVHHSYYEKGRPVWEYPDLAYHCLCERCHGLRAKAESFLLQSVHDLSARELINLSSLVIDMLDKRAASLFEGEMGIMEMGRRTVEIP